MLDPQTVIWPAPGTAEKRIGSISFSSACRPVAACPACPQRMLLDGEIAASTTVKVLERVGVEPNSSSASLTLAAGPVESSFHYHHARLVGA